MILHDRTPASLSEAHLPRAAFTVRRAPPSASLSNDDRKTNAVHAHGNHGMPRRRIEPPRHGAPEDFRADSNLKHTGERRHYDVQSLGKVRG